MAINGPRMAVGGFIDHEPGWRGRSIIAKLRGHCQERHRQWYRPGRLAQDGFARKGL